MVHLIPVIELSPLTFASQSHESPKVSLAEDPIGWENYWRACLADAGIEGIDPYTPGSNLVAISELVDLGIIRKVLGCHFEDCDLEDLSTICTLYGGLYLSAGDRLIAPGCCGDLSNISDWRRASQHIAESWEMVWIGHPWTHVRVEGDILCFAEISESDPPVNTEPFMRVPRADLLEALEKAEEQIAQFRKRLKPVLAELVPAHPVDRVLDVLLTAPH